MSPCPHAEERGPLLRASFALEASPAQQERLLELTRTCEACRAAYERMAAVERLVDGGEGMSAGASERVLERVLAAVPDVREGPRARPRLLAFGAPVLAAAAALAFFVLRAPDRGTYTERGGATEAPAFAVRVFCVPVLGTPRPLGAHDRCPKSSELAFAVSSKAAGRVRVNAVDAAGRALPGVGEAAVEAGAADAVLPLSVPLATATSTVRLEICLGADCRAHEVSPE